MEKYADCSNSGPIRYPYPSLVRRVTNPQLIPYTPPKHVLEHKLKKIRTQPGVLGAPKRQHDLYLGAPGRWQQDPGYRLPQLEVSRMSADAKTWIRIARAWKSKVQHHRCGIIEIRPGRLAYDLVTKMWRRESDRAVYACAGTLHERPCHGPCPPLGSAPPEAASLGH